MESGKQMLSSRSSCSFGMLPAKYSSRMAASAVPEPSCWRVPEAREVMSAHKFGICTVNIGKVAKIWKRERKEGMDGVKNKKAE